MPTPKPTLTSHYSTDSVAFPGICLTAVIANVNAAVAYTVVALANACHGGFAGNEAAATSARDKVTKALKEAETVENRITDHSANKILASYALNIGRRAADVANFAVKGIYDVRHTITIPFHYVDELEREFEKLEGPFLETQQ